MNKIALLGALALSAVSTFTVASQDNLRIGIEAAYPPFAFKTPDGKISGFDYDIGNALCAEMKVKCEWVEQEFDGLIPSLKVRKVDAVLSSMSITEDRLKSVDFSKKYYHTPGKLAMKAGSEIKDPLVDLKGKKVGVQRASTYDRFASDQFEAAGIEVVRYASQNEAFLDLASGRLDATLADIINIDEGLSKPQPARVSPWSARTSTTRNTSVTVPASRYAKATAKTPPVSAPPSTQSAPTARTRTCMPNTSSSISTASKYR